jgi:hypothetical protein
MSYEKSVFKNENDFAVGRCEVIRSAVVLTGVS